MSAAAIGDPGEPTPFVERFAGAPSDPVADSRVSASPVSLTRIGKDGASPLAEADGGEIGGRGSGGHAGGGSEGGEVWLNSPDRRFARYFRRIYRKVDRLWSFPKSLEVLFEQGDVLVQFTILADGRVSGVHVRKSSGFSQFDQNVVAAIRRAAPFGPLPQGLGRSLRVLAPFEFSNPMVR